MFPMISGLSDFIQCKNFIEQAKEDLDRKGFSYLHDIEVGIMIEVPSAAITADILARHVDFISIGTNDLVQYVMASDRLNPEVANLYTPYHPAMIRILNQVIKTANELDCPISICGELASDERFIPVFLGMGLREFSVSPRFVPKVKDIIRNMDEHYCENALAILLTLETTEQVEKKMRSIYHEVWLSL
jgi:phosphotransferase system enzyme I (PtsI)